jgi:hypothetical protein
MNEGNGLWVRSPYSAIIVRMRIKTTLRVGAVFSLGITLVVSAILFLASRKVDTAVRQSRHAYEMVQKVFESNLLLNEYLLRHGDETAAEWQAVHVFLGDLLSAQRLKDTDAHSAAEQIRRHHKTTGALFATLVEGNAEQRKNRKTPLTPSQLARKRKSNPRRKPGDQYAKTSYENAIRRACKKAKVPHWAPNQLRHSCATRVRRKYGIEGTAAVLGNSLGMVAEVYAEANFQLAIDIMRELG